MAFRFFPSTFIVLLALIALSSTEDANTAAKDFVDKAEKFSGLFEKGLEALGKDGYNFTKLTNFINGALPFVKSLGPAFAVIGMFIEKKDPVLEEMKKSFQKVDQRLDKIEWKLDGLTLKVLAEFQKLQYNKEAMSIMQVKAHYKNYQDHPSETTLELLREECWQSDPQNAINALYSMMTTLKMSQDFVGTIFSSVEYDAGEWLRWSEEIAMDFLQAMVLKQMCLGVQINDGKRDSTPTEQDMDYFATENKQKLDAVMQKLGDKAAEIQRDWVQQQLAEDVKRIMIESATSSKSEQGTAEAIYTELKRKYSDYFWGVTVHADTEDKVTKFYSERNSKVVPYNGRTAVVNWRQKSERRQNGQADMARNAANAFGCRKPSSDKPSDYRSEFMNHILTNGQINAQNFDMVYGIIYHHKVGSWTNTIGAIKKIGEKHDGENTYLHKIEKCDQYWGYGRIGSHYVYEVYITFGF